MKSYTDLDQSKKLAKILPPESADMGWNVFVDGTVRILPIDDWDLVKDGSGNVKFYPAWSLAALLDVLPSSMKDSIGMVYSLNMDKEYIEYSNPNISFPYSAYIHTCGNDNLVDACYEMIIKLQELKML